MSRRKVILDVDTGIDDALGIVLALRASELNVVGITTGYGATSVDQATENTLRILELLDQAGKIPVSKGAEKPLIKEWDGPVDKIHGVNGIGDYELPHGSCTTIEMDAADFIIRMADKYKDELVLICTARLTNLATALQRKPELKALIKEVVIMGGAVRVKGNVTPYAEANIHGDPEAAAIVLNSGMPITLVGLDVTENVRMMEDDLSAIEESNEPREREIDRFVKGIMHYYIQAYRDELGIEGCMMHDPLAVAVCIERDLVSTEKMAVCVEVSNGESIGQTKEDVVGHCSKLDVCTEVDENRTRKMFFERLFQGRRREDA